MSNAVKAVLLSVLVCPGSGHLLLKHYRRGSGIIALVVVALVILTTDAIQKAQLVATKIANGEIPLDAAAITAQIDAVTHAGGSALVDGATWVLITCWILAAVDAYRLGKQKDTAGG